MPCLRFVSEVKAGVPEVVAPVDSHLVYDIVPDERIVVSQPDILIVEGSNVLQTPARNHPLAVSDLFDFSIYVRCRELGIFGSGFLTGFCAVTGERIF